MFLARIIMGGIAALAIVAAAPAVGVAVQPGQSAITCVNSASGANWQIKIDFVRDTVDSNPANIDDATISWRDPTDGGNYTLDRKSGDLTAVYASSTGGHIIHDHCRVATSG